MGTSHLEPTWLSPSTTTSSTDSTSTFTGPDGTSRSITNQGYKDSHGRSKQTSHRQVGEQSVEYEEAWDGSSSQTLRNLREKELQQFEQQFEQLPRRNQQPKLALWDESWNPLVSELREFGFDDAEDAKAALTESNGDAKAAVKLLMAKERQHHQ